jgi:DNA recombination protein RmuC
MLSNPLFYFLLLNTVLIIVLLFKKSGNGVSEGQFEKRMGEFNQTLTKSLYEFGGNLNEQMQTKLEKISDKMQETLNQNLEKTNETFNKVIARLSRIDEAQKQIDKLGSNVSSLQDILTDKKSRGVFGEVQLNQLLSTIFGESQKVYSLQHKLSNGTIVDSALFLPAPIGTLAIDSKFPLENYQRLMDGQESAKDFKRDLKKHIDDIAAKYIIENETASQAVLFLPAEAIFAEVHAYHRDIIEYSHKKRVWICSPTTLMAVLTTIQFLLIEVERNKYTSIIHEELNKLGADFKRYQTRWDKLKTHIETVSKDVSEIHISTNKITGHFDRISQVDLDKIRTLNE